jgi:hypothetical protein
MSPCEAWVAPSSRNTGHTESGEASALGRAFGSDTGIPSLEMQKTEENPQKTLLFVATSLGALL